MINDDILNIISNTEAEISVVLKDLTNNKWSFKYNENIVFPSASIIKILIMVEGLNQVLEGKFKLTEKIPIRPEDKVDYSIISDMNTDLYTFIDLITLMIILSDNTATNVLIRLIGFDKINKMAERIGLKNTILRRKMMDFDLAKKGIENETSAFDTAVLMEVIYKKEILDSGMCELMINILKKQRDKSMLGRYIREKAVIAHKTGELPKLNHDIGIFYLDKIHYLLGVFIGNAKSNQDAKKTIGKISQIVFNYLETL